MGKNNLKCDFCGKSQDVVNKLIAGSGVYICNECVDLSNICLDESTQVPPLKPWMKSPRNWDKSLFLDAIPNSTCDFCHKRQDNVNSLISSYRSPVKRICNECIDLCNEILNEFLEEKDSNSSTKKKMYDSDLKCDFCGKSQNVVDKLIAGSGVYMCNECVGLCNEILEDHLPSWNWKHDLQFENRKDEDFEEEKIIRSIEFPSEYREAGTSILTYFSHVLTAKYPEMSVKVRIEQDGLTLRMIVDTPTGQKEKIERTLEEYGRVVAGQLPAELFLSDPFEVMALKNKLDMAHLELRQTRELLNYVQGNSQNRINSLEVEVNRLHCLIERSLHSKDTSLGVIEIMARQEGKNYDLRGAKFGGGFATEGGFQTGGSLIDASSTNNLSEAALESI